MQLAVAIKVIEVGFHDWFVMGEVYRCMSHLTTGECHCIPYMYIGGIGWVYMGPLDGCTSGALDGCTRGH